MESIGKRLLAKLKIRYKDNININKSNVNTDFKETGLLVGKVNVNYFSIASNGLL